MRGFRPLLIVLALALAACGGGGGGGTAEPPRQPVDPNAYFTEVHDEVKSAIDRVGEGQQDIAGAVAEGAALDDAKVQLSDALASLQDTLAEIQRDLNDLRAPADFAAQQDRLVEPYSDAARALGQLADDIDEAESVEALAAVRDGVDAQIDDLLTRTVDACVGLQEAADAQGIAVDLGCEDLTA